MTTINNHKTLTALVAISAIVAVLTGSVHMAFAQLNSTTATDPPTPAGKTITKTTTNTGVNVPTDTDQKQECKTAGGSSGIANSCTASSTDNVDQSGGIKK